MVNNVLILGGGSAGFLAAITLKVRLPQLPVTIVRSPDIGIIAVGEGSTNGVPIHLHSYLKLELSEFYRLAAPIWKLGIRFLHWGNGRPFFDYIFGYQLDKKYDRLSRQTSFYCLEGPWDYVGLISALMTHHAVFVRDPNGLPILPDSYAYHFENEKFVSYLEVVAGRLGVMVKDDTVVEVLQNDGGIAGLRLASGTTATADLYVDSSGFASVLMGQALKEPFISYKKSLFNDRALIGGWKRGKNEPIQPYTIGESMNAGWCWRIDHETRINRGYVYDSSFISDAEAESEYRAKNPKAGPTRIVKFKCGRYQRGWVKNVIAIGNAFGFVEPLEATSLSAICHQAQGFAETIKDSDGEIGPCMVRQYNKRNARHWDAILQFLALHFKFNTGLDTPYWQACRADTELAGAAEMYEYYKENGPSIAYRSTLLEQGDQFDMEGYLSMFVGQQVPCRKQFSISDSDRAALQSIRQAIQIKASRAYTVEEGLNIIRSANWRWPDSMYTMKMGVNR